MSKIRHFLSILLLVCILTGCGGGSVEKVETPSGMNMQRGRNYKEVIEDFEDKGFTNIRTEPIEDLLFSWRFKNGEVEEISVGGAGLETLCFNLVGEILTKKKKET